MSPGGAVGQWGVPVGHQRSARPPRGGGGVTPTKSGHAIAQIGAAGRPGTGQGRAGLWCRSVAPRRKKRSTGEVAHFRSRKQSGRFRGGLGPVGGSGAITRGRDRILVPLIQGPRAKCRLPPATRMQKSRPWGEGPTRRRPSGFCRKGPSNRGFITGRICFEDGRRFSCILHCLPGAVN